MAAAAADPTATITIIVLAAVLLVVIAGFFAYNKKILCWAEKFATFQAASYVNPTYTRDGTDAAGQGDGELYVHASSRGSSSGWVLT